MYHLVGRDSLLHKVFLSYNALLCMGNPCSLSRTVPTWVGTMVTSGYNADLEDPIVDNVRCDLRRRPAHFTTPVYVRSYRTSVLQCSPRPNYGRQKQRFTLNVVPMADHLTFLFIFAKFAQPLPKTTKTKSNNHLGQLYAQEFRRMAGWTRTRGRSPHESQPMSEHHDILASFVVISASH
ncbi:hypothetical protein CC80DRAFT_166614 [Byssothecium circinans]|uniref:Uncharacterized protein n=1 Tax=Byssothecium circinans TaxID=147558 RepID=A0A6A5TJM3_9PLEO|nr:hypothetical protein CC80DRAFT_166614 [Byssothecium circinans]